ncbi:MAG: S24 family peptidase [Actinomycetota bacterium]
MASAPIRRFVVTGDSMLPTYANGDLVFSLRSDKARPGQVRVFEHPHRPGMWLVKRVASVRDDGRMWVESDNTDATRADSREFGHLSPAGGYRVIGRLRARG